MRVTDGMMFDQAARETGSARDRFQQVTQETSSGVRVSQPGDDPASAGLIVSGTIAQGRYDAIAQTAQRASDELASADSALATVNNLFTRAQELAVQLANPVYTASQRASGASEVNGLLQQVVAALNTRVGNRYVFGGNKDGTPPFDSAGNYLGDDGVRQVEIAPGVLGAASVRADVAAKGAGGGVDALAALQQLSVALAANDPAAIRGALDPLSKAIDQFGTARAQAGNAMNALDAATAVNQAARDGQKAAVSKLADADIVDSATRLAQAQQALQAALAATSQGFQLSLLDYLK